MIGAIASKFRNAGQTCVCANRIFVHEDVYEQFTQLFIAKLREMRVGNGLHAGVHIGPLINAAACDKVEQHIQDALTHGGQLVYGDAKRYSPANGLTNNFIKPAV